MVFLEIFVAVLFIALMILLVKYIKIKMSFEQKIKEWIEAEEKRIREDAIARSSRILSGKALEKLIPFLEKFPFNAHDLRWLGDPIDFIIFDGNSANDPKQIVFCEVKSGKSSLSKTQNKIKDLVENKKVKWYEFKI